MMDLKFADIVEANRQFGEQLPAQRFVIRVLSNVTVHPLKDILEYTLRSESIPAEVVLGAYDQIVQESASESGRVQLLLWEAANLVNGLPHRIESMAADEIEALLHRVEQEIQYVVHNLRNAALVLWVSFCSYPFTVDNAGVQRYDEFVDQCNRMLRASVSDNMRIIDAAKLYASLSLPAAIDWRGWYTARALYSISWFKALAQMVRPWCNAITGRSAKVLLMDCDNTLWGGILGEDGEENIQLDAGSYPGNVYNEIQERARSLGRKGVLLGLCSKNNPADVDEVLRNHPAMRLRDDDLSVKEVSWQAKHESIARIANQLNLGSDSFVFLDDSSFELGLIAEKHPSVRVVQVPSSAYQYPAVFRQMENEFLTLSVSDEDSRRKEQYKEEQLRHNERERYSDLESYLRGLGIRLQVHRDNPRILARMAQLTQKTNQFNLTTRRYTEAEVQSIIADPDSAALACSVSDKYGDSGITALTLLRVHDTTMYIDSLLLSCRILGRNIELAFMYVICELARSWPVAIIEAEYRPTVKNVQVADFYERCGFSLISVDSDGNKRYVLENISERVQALDYIEVAYA